YQPAPCAGPRALAQRGSYNCAVAQASGAMAQLPDQEDFPRHSSCTMRSSQSPDLPFETLIAPCAAPLRHGAEPREKLFNFKLNCAMRSFSGAMAQDSEKILQNSIPFAPCAVEWRHGAAYRGLSSPILAQLRHAQHSCAMAQLQIQIPLFCLRNTQPSIRLIFHSL
ncbi:hypothetical protein L195_g053390, partial [Trifolium pratense]